MTTFSLIGYIALGLTSIAYFPQVFKALNTRSAADLSSVTLAMLFLGSLLWFMYGTYYRDTPLMVAHGLSAILTGIVFYMKLIWKNK